MGTRQVCGEAEFTAIFAETQERLPLPPLLPAKTIDGPPVLTPAGASEAHAGARRLLFYSYCTLRESFFSGETRPAVVDVRRASLAALVGLFLPLSLVHRTSPLFYIPHTCVIHACVCVCV